MIFTTETYIELNNGKAGKRRGPLLIPDRDLPTIAVEPLFTTKHRDYSKTQCIVVWNNKSYAVDYNIHDLQALLEELEKNKPIGFK